MGGKDHEIDIEEDPYASLVSSITKNELENVRPISSTTCIYIVPDRLRRAKEAAYTPKVVSIGPIHHDKSLRIIKGHKRRFLKNFLERTENDLIHYVKIVKDSEERLRGCYQETFELSSDEFCHIILVDAVFIVELFFCHYPEQTEVRAPDGSEWLSYARKVLDDISPEFLLLENQLPFFILEEIWKDATTKSIIRFFQWYYCLLFNLEEKEGANLDYEMPMHFVDLVRKLYIPHKPKSGSKKGEILQAPNATELHQAGIKFKVAQNYNKQELSKAGIKFVVAQNDTKQVLSKNLFDIRFHKGVLEIPKLIITDSTESRMRNLAAFEQCHYAHEESYICNYLIMLDYLVNTHEDVDLLVKEQIVENWIGESKDVSDMINELCVGINIDPKNFYFGDLFEQLDKYYKYPWNHWRANLKQNYFNTPWAVISFVAAFFLLILTVVQTIPDFTDWFHKKN